MLEIIVDVANPPYSVGSIKTGEESVFLPYISGIFESDVSFFLRDCAI